jgi:ribosomal protein L39E
MSDNKTIKLSKAAATKKNKINTRVPAEQCRLRTQRKEFKHEGLKGKQFNKKQTLGNKGAQRKNGDLWFSEVELKGIFR